MGYQPTVRVLHARRGYSIDTARAQRQPLDQEGRFALADASGVPLACGSTCTMGKLPMPRSLLHPHLNPTTISPVMSQLPSSDPVKKEGVPEGLWLRCPEC